MGENNLASLSGDKDCGLFKGIGKAFSVQLYKVFTLPSSVFLRDLIKFHKC